jgi:hypothetical protein
MRELLERKRPEREHKRRSLVPWHSKKKIPTEGSK